ncbi:MAG: UMP kinase [Firmicutes bacterium HGW-Firmicutes-7]|nr:MAG: UMP kinase [Firmicutes bacterium HGW-Firmicutes-7]
MSKYKRVMLKLSGEALSGDKGYGFDEGTVLKVADQVKKIIANGIQVGIVIGGGNFWRGRSNKKMDRCKADQIGMLATVMNCLYVAEVFRTIGIKATVQTPFPMGNMTEEFSKESALNRLGNSEVVFFAGGTGHPFFSTDTAVALRALEIEADVILLAKNIDGVYDLDPKECNHAQKFDKISLSEVVEKKLKVMDLTAAIMCLEHKMPMLVFYLGDENSLLNAVDDKISGTFVYV